MSRDSDQVVALRQSLSEIDAIPAGAASGMTFEPGAFPHLEVDPVLVRFFEAFNAGAFGFAKRDRDYIPALEDWQAKFGRDPTDVANVELLDRETCLLILRRIDRAERFSEGAWRASRESGLLNAIVERLIALSE
jgi:hypothetical protein